MARRNDSLITLTTVALGALAVGAVVVIAAAVISSNQNPYETPSTSTLASIAGWQMFGGWCIGIGGVGLIATLAVRAILEGFGKLEEPLPERPKRPETTGE